MTFVHAIAMLFCVEESRKGKLLNGTQKKEDTSICGTLLQKQ